jgi:hypothetical protein
METLIHLVEDHAKDKAVPIHALGLLFTTELNPLGWQMRKGTIGKGQNSWRMYRYQDGQPVKIWYFTGYDKGVVVARNDYFWQQATKKFAIKTRLDAIRFSQYVVTH